MNAKNILSSIRPPKETTTPLEDFNRQAQEILIDVSSFFKRTLSANIANYKFKNLAQPQHQLSGQFLCSIFYKDFSLLSPYQQTALSEQYAKVFCKHFKSCPAKAVPHVFGDGFVMIFVYSKNRYLASVFGDYMRISVNSFTENEKDSFLLEITFGDYLRVTLNIEKPYASLYYRHTESRDLDVMLENLQQFNIEIKEAIKCVAKAIRLTEL